MVTPNEIAVVRASGEKVFVQNLTSEGNFIVKRPVMTQDGIKHLTETFSPLELAAPVDFLEAEQNEMQELNNRMQAKLKARMNELKPADEPLAN